jgi:DNA-directed RNA polymerase subunit RPC12/RpoP
MHEYRCSKCGAPVILLTNIDGAVVAFCVKCPHNEILVNPDGLNWDYYMPIVETA